MHNEDLTKLEETLRRLKVEYDIFFNGNRKTPPDTLRLRVEKIIRRLSEAGDMTHLQRFRYNTLIARFHAYKELWRRVQTGRESALENGRRKPAASRLHTRIEKSLPSFVQVSIGDPESEADKIRHLYQGLLRMRGIHAEDSPVLSFQQFSKYILDQTRGIRAKYGCSRVLFRVLLEENRVRFTAKADDQSQTEA